MRRGGWPEGQGRMAEWLAAWDEGTQHSCACPPCCLNAPSFPASGYSLRQIPDSAPCLPSTGSGRLAINHLNFDRKLRKALIHLAPRACPPLPGRALTTAGRWDAGRGAGLWGAGRGLVCLCACSEDGTDCSRRSRAVGCNSWMLPVLRHGEH